MITIYTDGSSDVRDRTGGWAAVVLLRSGSPGAIKGKPLHTLQGHASDTTNNRMELMAAIAALEHMDAGVPISLWTDSQYLTLGITSYINRWAESGWLNRDGKPVANVDLWKRLLAQREYHSVTWRWVRGHSGDHFNEMVDRLASEARKMRISTELRLNEAARNNR